RAVVQSEREHHAGIACGGFLCPLEPLLDALGKFVNAANVGEAYVIAIQARDFLLQILPQQLHQELYLCLWPALPVFGGERIQREISQAYAGSGRNHSANRLNAGAVSNKTGQMPPIWPAAVAVHDDGNVMRQAMRIEPRIKLALRRG